MKKGGRKREIRKEHSMGEKKGEEMEGKIISKKGKKRNKNHGEGSKEVEKGNRR